MARLSHLFGRYTRVLLWTPIKQAEVFNPTRPSVMVLSFSLRLQLLTAIWQCHAVAMDATHRKGHSFILHIRPVLIFHSLPKNIKKGEKVFEHHAKHHWRMHGNYTTRLNTKKCGNFMYFPKKVGISPPWLASMKYIQSHQVGKGRKIPHMYCHTFWYLPFTFC